MLLEDNILFYNSIEKIYIMRQMVNLFIIHCHNPTLHNNNTKQREMRTLTYFGHPLN